MKKQAHGTPVLRTEKQPNPQESERAVLAQLNAVNARLWQIHDLHTGLKEILGATIELLGADFGHVQLYDASAQVLRMAVHRGFKKPFLDFFHEVSTRDKSACGRALRSGARVIVEDVDKNEAFKPYRKVAKAAGYRAVLSMPLKSGDGAPLGMISTFFRHPHRPDNLDLARLDLYVQMAASFIERCRAEEDLRASEERYRQLVQSLPAAVYTCDEKGRITLFNAEAVKLWGREPDASDRWDASRRILDADGRPMKRAQLEIVEAVHSGEPLRGMERIVERADGSRSHVLCFSDPLPDVGRRNVGALNMLVDITALKETQTKLHAALAELETLSRAVEQNPASVMITSSNGSIEYVNPKFSQLTGYSAAEVIGRNPRLLKSGELPPEFYQKMWETILSGHEWRGEFCNRKKNGELFWEYAVIAPIMNSDGKIRHFVAIKEDITERRRAITLLHEREELLRSILNTVGDAVVTIDERGLIINVNPATERMFGYTEAEMIGRNVKMLMPSPYREEHDGYLRAYRRTGQARIIGIGREAQARRKDGSVFPVELAVSQVDHMRIFTGVIRDITTRRELEKEILDVSESERAAIGDDLHDDLGQQLAGLWCMSQVLHDNLKKREVPEAAEAARISGILRQVLALTRSLARGLHPVALETGGLVAALRDLASRTRLMFGVPCRFHGSSKDAGLDQTTTTNLLRICQEAVTNAAKHAGATRIDITLSKRGRYVLLTVQDDGCGLPEDSHSGHGMGLRIMHHRASLIGAEFKIDPAPLGGTLMSCKVCKKTPIS